MLVAEAQARRAKLNFWSQASPLMPWNCRQGLTSSPSLPEPEAVQIEAVPIRVEIYRPHQPAEVRSLPTELSGERVLPGFLLPLAV